MMSVMILKVVDGRVSHTVWNLRKFALPIFSQKLREINAFLAKLVHCNVFSRILSFASESKFLVFPHCGHKVIFKQKSTSK